MTAGMEPKQIANVLMPPPHKAPLSLEQMRSGLESLKSALVEEPRPAERDEASRPLSPSNR